MKDPRTSLARFAANGIKIPEEWIVVVQPTRYVRQVSSFASGQSGREHGCWLTSARDEKFLVPVCGPNDQLGKMGLSFRERYCLLSHIGQYSHYSESVSTSTASCKSCR